MGLRNDGTEPPSLRGRDKSDLAQVHHTRRQMASREVKDDLSCAETPSAPIFVVESDGQKVRNGLRQLPQRARWSTLGGIAGKVEARKRQNHDR